MLQQSLTLAILFADISGSTSLYETLGDEDAHKLVSTCIHELSGVVADHRGTVIKTIGDGIMCTFPATDKAIEAAIAMQESIDSLPLSPPENHINVNIRIGIHWGPVIKQNYDVFGDAVNVAARMVSRAKSRQILTTQQTVDNLPEGCAANIKRIDRTTIKGKAGEVSIFEIVWEEKDQTIIVSNDPTIPVIYTRLHLKMGEQDLFVDTGRPSVVLGRQAQNDLVVREATASRVHARIEYRRGKFVLIDQSTNGTCVAMEGKKSVYVHNDEIVLGARGFISLGCEVDSSSPQAIHFEYEYKGGKQGE
ncbi:MAG TPA: adenylate/guanylate cyclase domain-containing protein [Deltaproteobacteria bacterium]|jgi:class 3 adenylate cyclase|nr:adenylate/guanylate cyclase domain-containing protein [Deltaproteobacteria bacterium]